MRFLLSFLVLLFLLSFAFCNVEHVIAGKFNAAGGILTKGLAAFDLSSGLYFPLHQPPPLPSQDAYVQYIVPAGTTAGTPSAFLVIQDNGNAYVYYWDSIDYHLVGYAFPGTVSHIYFDGTNLYAVGQFLLWTRDLDSSNEVVYLNNFAMYPDVLSGNWRNHWVTKADNITGLSDPTRVYAPQQQEIIFDDDEIKTYVNDPTNPRFESDPVTNGMGPASRITDLLFTGNEFIAYGRIQLNNDLTRIHGVVISTDLVPPLTWTPFFDNGTASQRIRRDTLIYFGDTLYFVNMDNKLMSAARGAIEPTEVIPDTETPGFSRAKLIHTLEGTIIIRTTSDVIHNVNQDNKNLLFTYKRYGENGFVQVTPSQGPQLTSALAGGVDNPSAVLNLYYDPVANFVYLTGQFQYTYNYEAFGMIGFNENGTWQHLGHPLQDGVNTNKYPGVDAENLCIHDVHFDHETHEIVIGGYFVTIRDQDFFSVAIYNIANDQFTPLGNGLRNTAYDRIDYPGTVHSIAVTDDGDFVFGGEFAHSYDKTLRNVALWKKSNQSWVSLQGGVDGKVWAVASEGNYIYVGGEFKQAGNVHSPHIARFNLESNSWEALSIGTNDHVYTIWLGDTVYIGGKFTAANGHPAYAIAKWDDDDYHWEPLDCAICATDCGEDVEKFCPSSSTVAHEIVYIPGLGLTVRFNNGFYVYGNDVFYRKNRENIVTFDPPGPGRKYLAHGSLASETAHITTAGVAGGSFFDNNMKIGHYNKDDETWETIEEGGFDGEITTIRSISSVLKPVLLLSAFLLLCLFVF